MNKKSLAFVLVLLVLVVGSLAYVFLSKTEKQVADEAGNSKKTPASKEAPANDTSSANASIKGAYLPYTSEAVTQAKGTVLLFFHAPWCPQCREIEKTINESGIPDNVTVLKIDYDTNQALRQKYGVTLQTTFVKVDNQGNKLGSYVAYDEPTFSSVQRELLP